MLLEWRMRMSISKVTNVLSLTKIGKIDFQGRCVLEGITDWHGKVACRQGNTGTGQGVALQGHQ